MNKHVSNIEVVNFKKFENLQVNNLGQINLIVGDNNIGKTSLLESLLFDENLKDWLGNLISALLHRFINTSEYKDENIFEQYFHEVVKSSFEIIATDLNGLRTSLKIRTQLSSDLNKEQLDELNLKNLGRQPKKFAVLFFKDDLLSDLEFVQEFYSGRTDYMPFISNATIFGKDLVDYYSEHFQKKKSVKETLIKSLSSVIPNIENIEISGLSQTSLLITLNNQDDARIINQFGEGSVKLLRILLEIHMCKNRRLMIDEIGTGIHYSKLKSFFELIFSECINNNVQLFASTHSKECIESYIEALKNSHMESKARIIRLAHTKKGIKAYTNTFEQFENVIVSESELR